MKLKTFNNVKNFEQDTIKREKSKLHNSRRYIFILQRVHWLNQENKEGRKPNRNKKRTKERL